MDPITIYSLLGVVALLLAAYAMSLRALSARWPGRWHTLFIWNAFNALIHAIFEGSYLYNCFFISAAFDSAVHHPVAITNFMNDRSRLYGPAYGGNWTSKLWQVYAKADHRWGGADSTVISLELLTVFGAGPLAAWICYGIAKKDWKVSPYLIVLATAELYGGWITFCPEWLTGSQNLDTSNFMFTWVYLFFFNMLWVVFPIYELYVAFGDIRDAFKIRRAVDAQKRLE
ncbi:Emopamil-binding protein [Calycina marina]|uniref:Emopamil-binding protein n=1 Tax=Calycina marina TaxID=1763456 RepID=A0A9P7Z6N2_9HELO|nr:Emopamil-binding protein [Calycina marina]